MVQWDHPPWGRTIVIGNLTAVKVPGDVDLEAKEVAFVFDVLVFHGADMRVENVKRLPAL